jgi:hypothetical protein
VHRNLSLLTASGILPSLPVGSAAARCSSRRTSDASVHWRYGPCNSAVVGTSLSRRSGDKAMHASGHKAYILPADIHCLAIVSELYSCLVGMTSKPKLTTNKRCGQISAQGVANSRHIREAASISTAATFAVYCYRR